MNSLQILAIVVFIIAVIGLVINVCQLRSNLRESKKLKDKDR